MSVSKVHVCYIADWTYSLDRSNSSLQVCDVMSYPEPSLSMQNMGSCSISHPSEGQQTPMSPSCHFQVMKGVHYVTVQNTSAFLYKHNLWASGKLGWEVGCSYSVWVWYATATNALILQFALIKEMKHSYWIQKRKIMQNNIQEATGIWDQRCIKGASPDCTLRHSATQNTLLQNQYCNLWMCECAQDQSTYQTWQKKNG